MNKLQENWLRASEDLEIEVVPDFILEIRSSKRFVAIKTELFVESFGMSKGMLVVTDYEIIAPHVCDLIELGYGFSILNENEDTYSEESFVKVLKEWGWAGDKSLIPKWLN